MKLLACAALLGGADAHGRMTTLRAGATSVKVRGGGGSNGGKENEPVGINTGPAFVCRNPKKPPAITITAGGTIDVQWDFSAAHQGDCALYLSYDDTNYFKIANFPECNLDNRQFVTVQLPAWLPNGVAVVRWDWYALHQAPSAELYTQCTDVTVAGSNGAVTVAALGAVAYSPIAPPIYPMRSGNGGTYRNPFNKRAAFFMTGPDCVGGVTGNCCDLSSYAYGKRYADCATTGASTGVKPVGVGSGGGSSPGGGTPTPPPTAATNPCIMHTVVSGDSMGAIAAAFSAQQIGGEACTVTAEQIATFNMVADPNVIDVGETFNIPCPGNCCTDNSCENKNDGSSGSKQGGVGGAAGVAPEEEEAADPAMQAKRDAESKAAGLGVAVGLLSTVVVGLLAMIYKDRRANTASDQGKGMKTGDSWLKPGVAGSQGVI